MVLICLWTNNRLSRQLAEDNNKYNHIIKHNIRWIRLDCKSNCKIINASNNPFPTILCTYKSHYVSSMLHASCTNESSNNDPGPLRPAAAAADREREREIVHYLKLHTLMHELLIYCMMIHRVHPSEWPPEDPHRSSIHVIRFYVCFGQEHFVYLSWYTQTIGIWLGVRLLFNTIQIYIYI